MRIGGAHVKSASLIDDDGQSKKGTIETREWLRKWKGSIREEGKNVLLAGVVGW